MTDIQPTTSLSDIFKRDENGRFAKREEVAAEPPVIETPAPTVEVVAPAVETPAAPPPSPTGVTNPGPSPVPEKVENAEVQALKAELARVRRQNRETPARPDHPVKPPSVFEDEEAYTNHLTSTIDERVFAAKLEMSEESARERFTDLKEVMGTVGEGDDTLHMNWVEAVKANPRLFDQFKRAANPVVFAYQELKRQAALKEVGDPLTYRERLRKEIEAELLAKAGGAAPVVTPAAKPAPVIPDTLAGSTSRASREAPEFNGPKPLTDIFKAAPHNQARSR